MDIDRKPIPEPEIRDNDEVFNDENEEPINRKSRMEKMHAVPTPLAAITQKSKHSSENNNVDRSPRRRSYEEDSIDKPPLEDSMVRKHRSYPDSIAWGGRRGMHALDINSTTTNSNKNKGGRKERVQMGRRGRSRSQGQLKKVSFDEESMKSTSSQHSRSESELCPQKRSVSSLERQYRKRSHRSQPTKQVTIQYSGTPSGHGPSTKNLEIETRLYEVAEDRHRVDMSVDEGFADLDDSYSSSKTENQKFGRQSTSVHQPPRSPMYSQIDAMTNSWMSEEILGSNEMTYESELDLSPLTHKSDTDLTSGLKSSTPKPVYSVPYKSSSKASVVKLENKMVPLQQQTDSPVMSRDEQRRLYGYSSESSEEEQREVFTTSFVRNSRQVGRRGRRNLSYSGEEKGDCETSVKRPVRSLSERDRDNTTAERRQNVLCSEKFSNTEDVRDNSANLIPRSEAVLLEKYIIRRENMDKSLSKDSTENHSKQQLSECEIPVCESEPKQKEVIDIKDAALLDVGSAEVCDLEESFDYSDFERGAKATSSTDNILVDDIEVPVTGDFHEQQSTSENTVESVSSGKDMPLVTIESFDEEPCVRRPKPHFQEFQSTKNNQSEEEEKGTKKTDSPKVRVQFSTKTDFILGNIPEHDGLTSETFSEDESRPRLGRYFGDSDASSCNSETVSPRDVMSASMGDALVKNSYPSVKMKLEASDLVKCSTAESSCSEEESFQLCSEWSGSNKENIKPLELANLEQTLDTSKEEPQYSKSDDQELDGNVNFSDDREARDDNHDKMIRDTTSCSHQPLKNGVSLRKQKTLTRGTKVDEDDYVVSESVIQTKEMDVDRERDLDIQSGNSMVEEMEGDGNRNEDINCGEPVCTPGDQTQQTQTERQDIEEKWELESFEFEPCVRRPYLHHEQVSTAVTSGIEEDKMETEDFNLCERDEMDHKEEEMEYTKPTVKIDDGNDQASSQNYILLPNIVITTPNSISFTYLIGDSIQSVSAKCSLPVSDSATNSAGVKTTTTSITQDKQLSNEVTPLDTTIATTSVVCENSSLVENVCHSENEDELPEDLGNVETMSEKGSEAKNDHITLGIDETQPLSLNEDVTGRISDDDNGPSLSKFEGNASEENSIYEQKHESGYFSMNVSLKENDNPQASIDENETNSRQEHVKCASDQYKDDEKSVTSASESLVGVAGNILKDSPPLQVAHQVTARLSSISTASSSTDSPSTTQEAVVPITASTSNSCIADVSSSSLHSDTLPSAFSPLVGGIPSRTQVAPPRFVVPKHLVRSPKRSNTKTSWSSIGKQGGQETSEKPSEGKENKTYSATSESETKSTCGSSSIKGTISDDASVARSVALNQDAYGSVDKKN